MVTQSSSFWLLTFTLAVPIPSAWSHDVWFTALPRPEAVQLVVHHGHPGDREVPDPHKLFDLTIDTSLHATSWPGRFQPEERNGLPILISEPLPFQGDRGLRLVGGQYDNGYWVKTEAGYRNTSKQHARQTQDSLSSMKGAKILIAVNGRVSGPYQKVLGHALEIVPQTNPFLLTPGDQWPIQVLFEGHPLAGVAVEVTDGLTPMDEDTIPRYRTKANGITDIPIQRSGPLLLVVDYAIAGRHPDEADVDHYTATLHVMLP